jgi:G3E family GTPase
MTIPVSILTGFLGAGKTTLLNRLLSQAELADSMVIINEFGEIGLDHLIVAAPAENTVLLRNGCLCCTVRGELTETLVELYRRRAEGTLPPFARVIVETTGLADPVPILQSLLGDDELAPAYRVGRVVTVVDAVNGAQQLSDSFEAQKQAAVADRIVLSKTDLADESCITGLERELRALNPAASVIRAVHGGEVSESLLDSAGDEAAAWHVSRLAPTNFRTGREESRHADVRTFTLYWDRPARREGLLTWLHMLASFRGPDLLRVKGIVNVDGRPVLVNAVQRLVHDPMTLNGWPSDDQSSRVVFITRRIERAAIEPTLAALGYIPPVGSAKLDPDRYAAFVDLAGAFYASRERAAGGS